MSLKKELGFLDVFCISSGAMISSGIFILPGLAFAQTGPSVFISYFLAGIMALIGVLSVVELSTAMPKAGGDYYFVNRSLGPMVGTVSGLFSWVAISLKSAFAIFGLSEILHLAFGVPLLPVAMILTAVFVVLNLFGVEGAAKMEVGLVIGLLFVMFIYIVLGTKEVNIEHFQPLVSQGFNSIIQTAGFVFVSFGGLISVASVSEEIKNPKRNIPLGLISAVLVVTILYAIILFVTVGILPAGKLSGSMTPLADASAVFAGKPGKIVMSFAAIVAFITTAIAGIMSASRYPLALSRDNLFPKFATKLNKHHIPYISLLMTGIFIAIALILPISVLVKAASTVILTANVLANISVIILRESKIRNYRPSFKTPLYPWLQIFSIIIFSIFIIDMGLATIEISLGMLLISLAVYFFYGKKRNNQEFALAHLIARITNKEIASKNLEKELREILTSRDEVIYDDFDNLVKEANVIDLGERMTKEELFVYISEKIKINLSSAEINKALNERENDSSTAISDFVAIPHLILDCKDTFKILLIRAQKGIYFSYSYDSIKAIFVILGSKQKRNLHLRSLAAIAQTVQTANFEKQWLDANNEQHLKDVLLLSPRKRDS